MVLDRTDTKDSVLLTPLQCSLSLCQEIAVSSLQAGRVHRLLYTAFLRSCSDAMILIFFVLLFCQDVDKELLLFYFSEVCYLSAGRD